MARFVCLAFPHSERVADALLRELPAQFLCAFPKGVLFSDCKYDLHTLHCAQEIRVF